MCIELILGCQMTKCYSNHICRKFIESFAHALYIIEIERERVSEQSTRYSLSKQRKYKENAANKRVREDCQIVMLTNTNTNLEKKRNHMSERMNFSQTHTITTQRPRQKGKQNKIRMIACVLVRV